jgi:hypothetical protein
LRRWAHSPVAPAILRSEAERSSSGVAANVTNACRTTLPRCSPRLIDVARSALRPARNRVGHRKLYDGRARALRKHTIDRPSLGGNAACDGDRNQIEKNVGVYPRKRMARPAAIDEVERATVRWQRQMSGDRHNSQCPLSDIVRCNVDPPTDEP